MKSLFVVLLLLSLHIHIVSVTGWLSVSPASNGRVDVYQLEDSGQRGKDVVNFPLTSVNDVIDPNAFTCGRCFCLLLSTNAAMKTSTLYNISFCLVPTPALESTLQIPGIAYNLHSNEGEGDGGSGYTVLIDHTTSPQSYHVIRIIGSTIVREVDISKYVDAYNGNIFPGGTAFCATSNIMWIAVQTIDPTHDTLLTLDLLNKIVKTNVSIPKPALSAHFADCANGQVGGFTITTNKQGINSIVMGSFDNTGLFTVLDQLALPSDSTLRLQGIADFLADPKLPWANPSEYGTILYSGRNFELPGAIFVSSAKQKGPAEIHPLVDATASIAVEY
jgi:hypothetical protein